MGVATAVVVGAVAAGVIAGSMKDHNKVTQGSGIDVNGPSANGAAAETGVGMDYGALRGMVDAGPGASDVSASTNSQRSLAAMLQQYSQGGNQPGAQDISNSNDLASKLFAGQRTALSQNFTDQDIQAQRQSALMGRAGNDPILQAKLATEQTRQTSMLDANQSGWASQNAMQQPMQRLGFAQDRANVLGGLATQAMSNRQTLASMGQSIQQADQTWRLNTGTKWGTQNTESGGGAKGAISGGIAAGGAAMGLMGGMGSFSAAPAATSAAGNMGGSSYFQGSNPYGMAGQGLQMPQQQSAPNFNSSSYQMGSGMGFGQPRTFSLGGR